MGNSIIEETAYTKFLGIDIDNHLTFKYHIENIATKTSQGIGIMRKLSYHLPTTALKTIYSSMVLPRLMFGVEIYYGTAPTRTNKLVT